MEEEEKKEKKIESYTERKQRKEKEEVEKEKIRKEEKEKLDKFKAELDKANTIPEIADLIGIPVDDFKDIIEKINNADNRLKETSNWVEYILENAKDSDGKKLFTPKGTKPIYETDKFGDYVREIRIIKKHDYYGDYVKIGEKNVYRKVDRTIVILAVSKATRMTRKYEGTYKIGKEEIEVKNISDYLEYLKKKAKYSRENKKKLKEKYFGPKGKEAFNNYIEEYKKKHTYDDTEKEIKRLKRNKKIYNEYKRFSKLQKLIAAHALRDQNPDIYVKYPPLIKAKPYHEISNRLKPHPEKLSQYETKKGKIITKPTISDKTLEEIKKHGGKIYTEEEINKLPEEKYETVPVTTDYLRRPPTEYLTARANKESKRKEIQRQIRELQEQLGEI